MLWTGSDRTGMVVVVVVGVVALVGAAFGLRGRAGRADRVDGDLSGWQDGLEALSRIDDRHHR